MVEADVDPREATDLVWEDASKKIEDLFKGGLRHRDIGELILQLEASVKAGRVTRKDGSAVNEGSDDYKTFIESDMAALEKYAIENADEFYRLVDEIEYMEEFSHQKLIDNGAKIYHKFTETDGKMVMEFKFPSKLLVLSGLFIESDLFSLWMEGASDGMTWDQYKDPTQLVNGFHINFPVPGKPIMSMDCAAVTYLDRKTNGILQVSTSIDNSKPWFGQDIIPGPEGSFNQKLTRMFRYIEKVDEDNCKHVVVSEFPLAEGMTKDFILEHMIKARAVDRVEQLYQTYHDNIKKYEERVYGSKKAYYDEIAKIFEDDE